jgi:hypothetical protein
MRFEAMDGEASPFDERFPEPLQGVVNHAERFSVALSLAETDESRDAETGPRESSLSETWVIGRAGEIETVVRDIVGDWRSGALAIKSAAAAIESYVLALHRGMSRETSLDEPTCCSNTLTVDLFSPREPRLLSYPKAPCAAGPPVVASKRSMRR